VEVVNQFTTTGVYAFMLTLARVSGLFLVAPVFSSRLIPVRAKLTIALAITLAAAPIAAAGHTMPTGVPELAVLTVKEVIVGSAIAFSVSLTFAAIAFAGGLIDLTVGFSFANVLDPLQNVSISIMGQLYSLLASAVFVVIGGPGLVIAGLVRSFSVVPVTAMPNWPSLTGAIVASMGSLFAIGLQVAAPVLVTLLVTDAAVGFLARIAPQMNIFGIELPGKIIAMFILLVVTAPFLVTHVAGQLTEGIARMFAMLVGGGA
jgi:flagellar biosynthetic protein FliR